MKLWIIFRFDYEKLQEGIGSILVGIQIDALIQQKQCISQLRSQRIEGPSRSSGSTTGINSAILEYSRFR